MTQAGTTKRRERSAESSAIVIENLPLVRKIASSLVRRLPVEVELDDLINIGVIGLMDALERYNPELSSSFQKFAEFRIRGSILDDLRRRDLMSRDARIEQKKIESTMWELSSALGRPPEDEELAARLHLDVDVLREKLLKLTPVKVLHVDDLNELASLTVESETPEIDAEGRELRRALAECIERLPERAQTVLQLYYVENLTLRQAGEVLGVSESRVSQLMSDATVRLRSMMHHDVEKKKKKTKKKAVVKKEASP